METPSRLPLPELQPEPENWHPLQCQRFAEVSSAKGLVKDWLTVTKWIPPVNETVGHFLVTDGTGNRGSPWDRLRVDDGAVCSMTICLRLNRG
jgi:hypothetical protein